MPGINKIKFINSLKQKKNRQQHRLFIIEGEKMVDELMDSHFDIHSVYAIKNWIMERGLAPGRVMRSNAQNFPLYEIKGPELGRISSLTTPNKVLALARIPSCSLEGYSPGKSLTLMLDKVQDPGNLGTLIRSADWFGVDNIILSEDSAEATNPKVVQSTMGSIFRVRFHYLDLQSFLESPGMEGIPVLGAFTGAPPVCSICLPEYGVIVLGNESQGISPEIEKFLTQRISIPSFHKGSSGPESLNVAVAGSIILSEFRRKNIKRH
jgi:RNA methyltransferase, TrmH family